MHPVPRGHVLAGPGPGADHRRPRPRRGPEVLEDAADNIFGRAFCALGDGAASPIKSSLKYFRDEYLHLIEHGGPPPDGIEPHAGIVTDNAQSTRPAFTARPELAAEVTA